MPHPLLESVGFTIHMFLPIFEVVPRRQSELVFLVCSLRNTFLESPFWARFDGYFNFNVSENSLSVSRDLYKLPFNSIIFILLIITILRIGTKDLHKFL